MSRERLYIVHILECIERIEAYTRSGRTAFLEDVKSQDAVLRNLQVLAESVKRLSGETIAKYPAIDWRGVVSLRNILVHDYLGVKVERVWEIVERDLPILKQAVEDIARAAESTPPV